MAILTTILKTEDERQEMIHLYREGIFLAAYEWSAYLFLRNIKEYKIKRTFYKGVSRNICSLGFPEKAFPGLLEGIGKTAVQTEEGYTIPVNITEENGELFNAWCEGIAITERGNSLHTSALPDEQGSYHWLAERIKNFDLVNESPVRCMAFVAELQKELKTNGKS